MSAARILVVDDEADIRGLLQDILSDEGYEVDVAADHRHRTVDRHPAMGHQSAPPSGPVVVQPPQIVRVEQVVHHRPGQHQHRRRNQFAVAVRQQQIPQRGPRIRRERHQLQHRLSHPGGVVRVLLHDR